MIDHIFLFLYIITVGLTFASVFLSLLYWMQCRGVVHFRAFVFIAYLALLLLLAGVRFYWKDLLEGGTAVIIGTGMAEFLGYALLLYVLPATLNHALGRPWTALRLSAAITASTVYFSLGVVYLLTGFIYWIAMSAGLLFTLALAVILLDIALCIPQTPRGPTRITVLTATILTFSFLPLVMLGWLFQRVNLTYIAISHSLRFLFLTLYYFWMSLTGIVFFLQEMGQNERQASALADKSPDSLPLTEREKDVTHSFLKGLTYSEIAEELEISPNTVRNHVASVYKKLSVKSKIQLLGILKGKKI